MSDSKQSYLDEQLALIRLRQRESDEFAAEMRKRTMENLRHGAIIADPAALRILELISVIAIGIGGIALLIAAIPALLRLGRWLGAP